MTLVRPYVPRSGQSVVGPVVLALLVLALTPLFAQALTWTFTTLDPPGASSTRSLGINNGGRIMGSYLDSGSVQHAFVWEAGAFTQIDPPGAVSAQALRINDAGQIVGSYKDSGGTTHPFLWDEGTFTPIDLPGAFTGVAGIDAAGQIVGGYKVGSVFHIFLWHEGTFTNLDPPGAVHAFAVGVNAVGQVIGNYNSVDCPNHGFLWDEGTFTTLDAIPCSGQDGASTIARGINSAGQIIGTYLTPFQTTLGFLWDEGTFTTIAVADEFEAITAPLAINDAGQVVGTYQIRNPPLDTAHAFYWEGSITNIDPPDAVPDPEAGLTAVANGINAAGVVRGVYMDSTRTQRNFAFHNGTFTRIDFPGAISTSGVGMNDAGEIVGVYQDSSGVFHGFLGKPAVSVSGLTHLNSMTTSFNAKPAPGGPAGTFTIEASFSNTSSTPIDAPQFVVTQISNGNLLLNADLPPGTVGARLTPDVGSDEALSPGESFAVQFVIGLQKRTPFSFRVGLLGGIAP